MEILRIGVIGLGMGRYHVAGYQSHPAAEVIAVADLDPQRLQEIADKYNVVKRYPSGEEMLEKEKLDVVSVVTPNISHKKLTIAALQAGCHVLCEKPMALNAAEARQMIATAKQAGKRLMINFSYRFYEQTAALKKQMDAGVIGEVYFARTIWHRRRGIPGFGGWFGQKAQSGGGPLIDLGVHRLDLALWLMGYPKPVWVLGSTYNPISSTIARAKNVVFDVEDMAVGMVKFANGATLEIEASWAANIKESELMETRLYGTKGGLVHHNVDESYKFEAELHLEQNEAHFDLKLHPPLPPITTAYFHFIDCITKDIPHIATGEEGLLVMEILDAIYQSAREGKPVYLG